MLSQILRRTTDPPPEVRQTVSISDPSALALFGSGPSPAGVAVNEHAVMGLSSVYRAVSLIAGSIATLPSRTVQQVSTSSQRVPSWLDDPAGGLTRFERVETTVAHLLINGNAFLGHIYGGAGQLIGVTPFHPQAVGIDLDGNGVKTYRVTLCDGTQRTFNDQTLNRPRFYAHFLCWEGWRDAKQVRREHQGQGGAAGPRAPR
jgi:phage portal protein BeeE